MGNSHSIPTHFHELADTVDNFVDQTTPSNLIQLPSLTSNLICVSSNHGWVINLDKKSVTPYPITWNTPRDGASIQPLGDDKIIGFGGFGTDNNELSNNLFVLQLLDKEEGMEFVELEPLEDIGKASPQVSFGFTFDSISQTEGEESVASFMLFGGECSNLQSGEITMNRDCWKLKVLAENQCEWECVFSESKMQPEARKNHGSGVVGDEIIYLFGDTRRDGLMFPELIQEVWSFNSMTYDWTLLENISGSGPKKNRLSRACTGVIGDNIVMFGGENHSEISNQVFILTKESGEWAWVGAHLDSESKLIPHRLSAKSGIIGHNLVVVGGTDSKNLPCTEHQVFSIEFDVEGGQDVTSNEV